MRFRLGATSYIYPADILPNVRRLAGVVDDVELVLFEMPEASNLPNAETIAELRKIAASYGMSYTVHLPLDLQLGAEDERWAPSVEKARRVIRATRPLEPWAYIAHLNIDHFLSPDRWQRRCALAMEILAQEAGGPGLLSVENLENCPLEMLIPVLDAAPVSLCLDVGHLWLAGLDPLPALRAFLKRARVVHLYGTAGQGHRSLCWAAPDSLRAVLGELVRQNFLGVVTLEVFSAEEFFSSRRYVLSLLEEIAPYR